MKPIVRAARLLALSLLVAGASSCLALRNELRGDKGAAHPDDARKVAMAELEAKSGSAVSGTVTFLEESDGSVRVIASLRDLEPGAHGIHIHEVGDCSAADGSSAGPHFAGQPSAEMPKLGTAHGYPKEKARHAGDLGNIVARRDGTARLERRDEVIALEGERSVIGRAVVIHRRKDDGDTVQSAGDRIACGVIVEAGSDSASGHR